MKCRECLKVTTEEMTCISDDAYRIYWCPSCGTLCYTRVTALDPLNETIIKWINPETLEQLP